jgi:hypothetical protein
MERRTTKTDLPAYPLRKNPGVRVSGPEPFCKHQGCLRRTDAAQASSCYDARYMRVDSSEKMARQAYLR